MRNDNRIWIPLGSVSATTRAPRRGAGAGVELLLVHAAGVTPSTFQLSGRSAANDIEVMRSTSSSVKPLRQPAMISSSCVPGWLCTAPARRTSSSRVAAREGTGLPSPSLCVGACDVEKPIAPASSASCSSCSIWSIWSSVAASPTASAPITTRRSAECPVRKPAFTAVPLVSTRWR